MMTEFTVQSSFKLNLPPHLIITTSSVKLNEIIGQGIIIIQLRDSLASMHINAIHKNTNSPGMGCILASMVA